MEGGEGSRRFNVNAGGQRRLSGYDTYQRAGGAMRAVREQFDVTVAGQILNLAFLRGSADNSVDLAHVAALEVERLPAAAARLASAEVPPALPAVRLYPNPVSHALMLQLPFPADRVKAAAISDATGRVLLTDGYRRAGENQLQWNVTSLSRGLYLLEVQTDQGRQRFRFLKQ